MTNWRELQTYRKTPKRTAALAESLLQCDMLTEWEREFLGSKKMPKAASQLNTRQLEKLLEIRDDCEVVDKIKGFSVVWLGRVVFLGRLDLLEDDEMWVRETVRSVEKPPTHLARRKAFRLLALAKRLDLIEEYV